MNTTTPTTATTTGRDTIRQFLLNQVREHHMHKTVAVQIMHEAKLWDYSIHTFPDTLGEYGFIDAAQQFAHENNIWG